MMRRRLRLVAATALAATGTSLLVLEVAIATLPFPEAELTARFPQSLHLVDRNGRELREAANSRGARARWTSLDQMSELAAAAAVAVEDERFWKHHGVDAAAALRAALQNLGSARVVSGASTITMQLARELRDHPHDLRGKILQAFDALRIERTADKQTILEHYLNRVTFGAGTVGLEAAAQRIFGKPSRHLSLAEAALLAGLPQSPTHLNPLNSPRAAERRQRTVLRRMLETGVITPEEHRRALAEPLRFVHAPPPLAAMHFTDYVLARGPAPGEIHTTLDLDLQQQIEGLVGEHVAAHAAAGLTNAAVVVLDNHDLGVLAMVGSANYWDGRDGAVNGATALRQPGSALKPFTYALAFERGFTPASVVADIEVRYQGAAGALFAPRNYSAEFSGPVLLYEALGRSLNVPAIRLANTIGPADLLERLRQAGFESLDGTAGHYGLGLTLGNGEVSLLELARAYVMLANGGLARPVRVLQHTPVAEPTRVFSEEIAFLITQILADESLRLRAFGAANPLMVGFPMAVKTGTSSNWRDSWAVGFTDRFTVAVWAGDFTGSPMDRLSGSLGAGPLFHHVARLVVGRGAVWRPPQRKPPPAGVEEILVCGLSGMTPTEICPHRRALFVQANRDHPPLCSWHRELRIDRRNGLLASGRCPDEHVSEQVFEVLPARYASWQATHRRCRPPTRYSPMCPLEGVTADALVVTSPRHREVYLVEPGYDLETQTLHLSGEVDPPVPEVAWLVDGVRIAAVGWPYEASWPLAPGHHRIEMVAGGRRSESVELEVR